MTDNIRCPWDRPTPWEQLLMAEQDRPEFPAKARLPVVVRRIKDKENE